MTLKKFIMILPVLILFLLIQSTEAVEVNISGPDENVNRLATQQINSILTAVDLISKGGFEEAKNCLIPYFNSTDVDSLIADAQEFQFTVLRDTLHIRVIGNSSPFTVRSIEVIGSQGNYIQSFCIAILIDTEGGKSHLFYSQIDHWINFLLSAASPKEFKNRLLLSNFLDKLILAYNDRNISVLERVYAPDGVVLVGKVVDRPDEFSPEYEKETGIIQDEIQYSEQSGAEYVRNLRCLFNKSRIIHVDYDGVELRRLTRRNNTYSIIFDQTWLTVNREGSEYNDQGVVLLVVELTQNDFLILNRIWGPSPEYFTPRFIDNMLSYAGQNN